MKTTTLLRAGLALSVAVMTFQPAEAAEFATFDGGRITLEAVVGQAGSGGGNGLQRGALLNVGVAWTVQEPSGTQHQGVFARSGSLRDDLPLMVQNPTNGELHLIYSSAHEGSKDLFLRTWLGQSWSDPIWLAGTADGDDLGPRVAFTATGEIVLAWLQQRPDGAKHVLFQYGVMDASGMLVRHAHVDMGRSEIYTLPIDGDVNLGAGVAHLVADSAGDKAILVLADSDADDVGLMRLDLRALRQIGGGGSFAPVPVNFLQVAMGNGPGSISDRIAAAGELLPTWRVEMLGGEGYYWFDDETMSGLAFRDGAARDLVTLDRPDEEIEAHAAMVSYLRMSLGRIQIELEPLLARGDAHRSRRLR